jgi:uncharacterized protein
MTESLVRTKQFFGSTQFLCWMFISCILFLIAGCETTSDKPVKSTSKSLSAQELLSMAEKKPSPEKESLILDAVQVYLDQQDNKKAKKLLAKIDPDQQVEKIFIKYSYVAAQLALLEGEYHQALEILSSSRLEQQWQNLSIGNEKKLREVLAQTYDKLGNTQASVSERIKLAVLLTNKKEEAKNQEALWQSLMKMNFTELQIQAEQETGDAEKGWYSLAAIAKNHQVDLETQRELLQQWMSDWRRHPARNNLPTELSLIQNLVLNQPKRIALLLPQSGKLAEAGEALGDGFFAAYYQAMNSGRQVPEVIQYDSSGDIIQLYQQAVNEGAELIIGPVEKEKVAELSMMPALEVPVLALNYADASLAQSLPGFYQFGLAVEDEARQVARQAFAEGKRQAMLIIPQQEWSQRAATAFTQEWESLGGLVVNRTQFFPNMNFSNLVKDVMLIESSQIRTRQLENFLGMTLESAPRSRSDVDMIFLIADPIQARQIKPMFAFHYAGDIPVYATSQIYSGTPNPKADADLNGVRFNTMPWLFDTQSPEKIAIAKQSNSAAVYGRLHALGVDAYRLYARLPQMAKAPDMKINGATGTLRLINNGRVEREQLWVRFNKGTALALPMVVEDDNE